MLALKLTGKRPPSLHSRWAPTTGWPPVTRRGCAKTTRCPSPATKMETDRWTPGHRRRGRRGPPRRARGGRARRAPLARHDRATQPPRRLSRTRRAGGHRAGRRQARPGASGPMQARLVRRRRVRRGAQGVLRQRHRALPPAQSTDVHARGGRRDAAEASLPRAAGQQASRRRRARHPPNLALLDLSENPNLSRLDELVSPCRRR